jgi:hypothetical protein
MDIEQVEKLAAAAAEFRAIEFMLLRVAGALAHDAAISNLTAEDAAEAERSIPFAFTIEESAEVFAAAAKAVKPRFERVKAAVAAASQGLA